MKNAISTFLQVTLVALLLSCMCACLAVVPAMEAFHKSGATEEDRMALLPQDVKKFSDALSWGDKAVAANYVAVDSRIKIGKQLAAIGEGERYVEAKIADVEWIDNAKVAKVKLRVKYFKIPFYVINTRDEQQEWIFEFPSGWRLKDLEVIDG